MKQIILVSTAVLLLITTYSQAGSNSEKDCYPITASDLLRKDAPTFNQFPVQAEKITQPPRVNIKSHPLARKYRTVIKHGIAEGPNFAGHFTVVGWGCGSSCVQFAVVDIKTGKIIFIKDALSSSGVHLSADDFEPNTQSQFWGLRYKLDSRLLIILGALDEDENREGAFYFLIEKDKLKQIYSTKIKKKWCDNSANK